MSYILAIETTTKNCSVALFKGQELIAFKDKISEKYLHSEKLTIFINYLIRDTAISFDRLEAVIISKGPGSYTGLRIGTGTAKGLCYALNIPLISVSTLKAMAYAASQKYEYPIYCPMIDARRMEVFSALYNKENNQIRTIKADIIDSNIYENFLDKKVLFFGQDVLKFENIINHENADFIDDIFPSAKDLGFLGYSKFLNNSFEDVAYFEPYYLKDFIVDKKRK